MSDQPDLAEKDQVSLSVLPDGGPATTIRSWTRYSFNSHFLRPTGGWHFEIGGKTIDKKLIASLAPGVKIQLSVNGHPQCTGRVDDLEVSADRHSGTVLRLSGRDMLGQVLDANADPQLRFTKDMTLQQFLESILVTQFHFTAVLGDSLDNRGVVTGQNRGEKRSKKGKPLKSIQIHQIKPYAHESALGFIERIIKRHGFWIWNSADGKNVIVDVPDFESDPLYSLRRRTNTDALHNNILAGTVRLSMADQPTHLVCCGFGGGGDVAHTRLRCLIGNPVFSANNGPLLDRYPDIQVIQTDFTILSPPAIDIPEPRVVYLYDPESRSDEQLANFARRMLAERMHQSLTAYYEVAGHTQAGIPWAVDTIVNVQDDIGGLSEPMYVLSRTFTKDRQNGARTQLELIRPGSLVF